MRKRLLKVKWENVLLLLFIPLSVIQFIKANIDFKILSLLLDLVMYGGFYLVVQTARKEALQKVKYEIDKPILEPLLNYLCSYVYGFRSIKKEIIKQARYINDQAYILRASFK